MLNNFLNSLIPQILLIKLFKIRRYFQFWKFKKLVAKNVKLKDIHKGERCFLLGSGPSIKKENLLLLKDEIVFALNNFYVHEDFTEIMSGNKPKYYMTAPIHPPQTDDEWKRWFKDMESKMPKKVNMIFGLSAYKKNIKYIFDRYEIFKREKINWYFAGIGLDKFYKFKSRDIDFVNPIWSASTVSTYAILAAIYMGFSEIYLLGVDHNYVCLGDEENHRFYKSSIHQKDEIKRMKLKKSEQFMATSHVFYEKELISVNTDYSKIYNCSKESLLDMFVRIELNSLMK